MKTTIAHLHCQYRVPNNHPDTADLRARLDRVARDELGSACSRLLTNLLDERDTSIWLIRRLEVEVSLNVGSLERAAEIWASQLVRALLRAVTPGAEFDQEQIRYFPDYSAYTAQFVSDLAQGRAWGQWYYRHFDSLASLSTSAAIRTVLLREPEQITAILAQLAAHQRLEPMLGCLSATDARQLYELGYPASAPASLEGAAPAWHDSTPPVPCQASIETFSDPIHVLEWPTHQVNFDRVLEATPPLASTASTELSASRTSIEGNRKAERVREGEQAENEEMGERGNNTEDGKSGGELYSVKIVKDVKSEDRIEWNNRDREAKIFGADGEKMSVGEGVIARQDQTSIGEATVSYRDHASIGEAVFAQQELAELLPRDNQMSEVPIEGSTERGREEGSTDVAQESTEAHQKSIDLAQTRVEARQESIKLAHANVEARQESIASVQERVAEAHPTHKLLTNVEKQLTELLLANWSRATLQLSGTRIATPHNALRLYTTVWEQVSQYPPIFVRESIEHIFNVAELLRLTSQPIQLATALVENDLTAALEILRAERRLAYLKSLSYLQESAAGDTALLRRVVATVATSLAAARVARADRAEQRLTTLLGGLFLLLPSFIDLKLREWLENAPYPGEKPGARAALLSYLTFLKCFGPLYAQWPTIAHDPILRLISGVDDRPIAEMLAQLGQAATPEWHLAWQSSLLKQLVEYRYAEGRALYAELLTLETGKALLIRDLRRDTWLSLQPIEQGDALISALAAGLAMVREATGQSAECIGVGAGLDQLSPGSVFLDENIHYTLFELVLAGDDKSAIWIAESTAFRQEQRAELLASLQPLKAADKDLRYLTLHHQSNAANRTDNARQPQLFSEQRALELTISLAARTLLRAFACRLLGFDRSSLEYLYRNFLAGTSSVLLQPDHLEVQLPSPPLHLILRLAGLHRQSYTIPWLESRQVSSEMAG